MAKTSRVMIRSCMGFALLDHRGLRFFPSFPVALTALRLRCSPSFRQGVPRIALEGEKPVLERAGLVWARSKEELLGCGHGGYKPRGPSLQHQGRSVTQIRCDRSGNPPRTPPESD